MSKATHSGTCQCCGNSQKLPSGVLSQHGYTVENGWFSGICLGAGHAPFEESCELIEGFIAAAQQHCVDLEASIKQWSEETVRVMRHTYIRNQNACGHYEWMEVELIQEFKPYDDDSGQGYFNYRWSDGGVGRGFRSEFASTSKENHADAVKQENEAWISKFKKQLAATEQYIEWQQNRVENWKPAKLAPIK